MKSLFEEEDPEQSKAEADLTLGIGSLLSIFFGVVLICGIFFGFGYSMGRRNAHTVTVPVTAVASPSSPDAAVLPESDLGSTPPKAQPYGATPFPPDATSPSTPAESKSSASPPSSIQSSKQSATESASGHPAPEKSSAATKAAKSTRVTEPETADTSLNAVPFTHRAPLPTKPHAGIMAPTPQPPAMEIAATPGHPVIVQIAAVSRQEDAEILAGALRKRGFSPSVHPGTTDKFFHVQVGPFTDKSEAETIKQHLLADGYNAIMK